MISAATGQGTEALMRRVGQIIRELKKAEPAAEPVQELVLPTEEPAPWRSSRLPRLMANTWWKEQAWSGSCAGWT